MEQNNIEKKRYFENFVEKIITSKLWFEFFGIGLGDLA